MESKLLSDEHSPRDHVRNETFKVRSLGATLTIPLAYKERIAFFEQHEKELQCRANSYVGICFPSYKASPERNLTAIIAALVAGGLVSGVLLVMFGNVWLGNVVAMVFGVFAAGVAYGLTLNKRKGQETKAGTDLPDIEDTGLVHLDQDVLTLFLLIKDKSTNPPIFKCDRAIEIDLRKSSAQTSRGTVELTLSPDTLPLKINVIDDSEVPPDVMRVLCLERPWPE